MCFFGKKRGLKQKGKKREEIGQTINYLLDNGDQLTQLVKVKLNHSLWAAAHHAHERRHDLGEEGHALQTKSFEDEHHCLNHSSVVSAQRRVAQDLHQGYEAEKERKVRTHLKDNNNKKKRKERRKKKKRKKKSEP